jgi:hypothetical protein
MVPVVKGDASEDAMEGVETEATEVTVSREAMVVMEDATTDAMEGVEIEATEATVSREATEVMEDATTDAMEGVEIEATEATVSKEAIDDKTTLFQHIDMSFANESHKTLCQSNNSMLLFLQIQKQTTFRTPQSCLLVLLLRYFRFGKRKSGKNPKNDQKLIYRTRDMDTNEIGKHSCFVTRQKTSKCKLTAAKLQR